MKRPVVVILAALLAVAAVLVALLFDRGAEPEAPVTRSPRATSGPTAPGQEPRVENRPRTGDQKPNKPKTLPPPPMTLADIEVPIKLQRGDPNTILRGCVLRPTGDPLPAAIVELIQISNATILAAGERVRVAEPVVTDSKGCFAFTGFSGGRGYCVRVEHGSYAPFEVTDVEAPERTETRLPDIRVAAGAALIGTITGPDGKPFPGARVIAFARQARFGGESGTPVRQVLSDDRGDFALENLAIGGYALTVEGIAMRTVVSPVVELRNPNERVRRDFKLEPGKSIRGKVLSRDGEPVAEAIVEARAMAASGLRLARAVTDEHGTFDLTGLGSDPLRLTASRKGFGDGVLLDVKPGDGLIKVLRLASNFGITGFVSDLSSKKPITSFGLLLWTINRGDTLGEPRGAMQVIERSADGSFTIEDVPPGEYRVQAFADGFSPTFTKTFPVRKGWVHGVTIELDLGATLVGRVVGSDGKPKAGATVRMFENAYTKTPISRLLYGDLAEIKKPVTTDAAGKFRFENLAGGAVQLRLSASDHIELVMRDVQIPASGETDLGELRLGTGGGVKGMVIAAGGGVARNARVSLRDAAGETRSVKTNNDGEFEFANQVPGDYTLSAEPAATVADSNFLGDAIAAARTQKTLKIEDGVTLRVDIQLVKL